MRGIVVSAGLTLLAFAGCGGDSEFVTGTTLAVGSYRAIAFRITPDGEGLVDVLAAGGSLSITLDHAGAASGTLVLPASAPGGPLTASMAGTATVTGLTVRFDQNADTFVRQVAWNRIGTGLQLISERIGSALYDVALERQ